MFYMPKIKKLFMVTPSGAEYPHVIKENHLGNIDKKDLPKILKSYMLPKGWTMKAKLIIKRTVKN